MLSGVAGPVALLVLAAAVGAATLAIARFRSRPTPMSAKRSEAAVGVAALATHLAVILTLIAEHGVRITP